MNGTGGLTSSVQTVPRTGKLYFYWINSTGNGGHSVQSSLIQTGVPIRYNHYIHRDWRNR